MQVRAGRSARAAGVTHDRALGDDLPEGDVEAAEMPVAGRDAVAVVDLDHVAVAAGVGGRDYGAAGRGARGGAHGRAEIDAGVHGRAPADGGHARPEAAG